MDSMLCRHYVRGEFSSSQANANGWLWNQISRSSEKISSLPFCRSVELLLQLQFTIGKKAAGQLYWHLSSSNSRISRVCFQILIQDIRGYIYLCKNPPTYGIVFIHVRSVWILQFLKSMDYHRTIHISYM